MLGYRERVVSRVVKSKVYFNLHKKCFSVQQNGLVVLHSKVVTLKNATFKVSEKGRQRVLKEQKKNVHAYVVGKFTGVEAKVLTDFREAYYNPYKVDSFVDKETGEPLETAEEVVLIDKKIFYK